MSTQQIASGQSRIVSISSNICICGPGPVLELVSSLNFDMETALKQYSEKEKKYLYRQSRVLFSGHGGHHPAGAHPVRLPPRHRRAAVRHRRRGAEPVSSHPAYNLHIRQPAHQTLACPIPPSRPDPQYSDTNYINQRVLTHLM